MAKARVVIGDQSSAEMDALKRSFNSLLVVLEQIAIEVDATTLTAIQGFTALKTALSTGVDTSSAPHVGTGRFVVGVKSSPVLPPRGPAETTEALVSMSSTDKF